MRQRSVSSAYQNTQWSARLQDAAERFLMDTMQSVRIAATKSMSTLVEIKIVIVIDRYVLAR